MTLLSRFAKKASTIGTISAGVSSKDSNDKISLNGNVVFTLQMSAFLKLDHGVSRMAIDGKPTNGASSLCRVHLDNGTFGISIFLYI
jgi:hypothetical protein